MQRKFLENLYYGNIIPGDRGFKQNKKLYKISQLSSEAYEEMLRVVPEEYHEVIDKYVCINTSYTSESEFASFVFGLKYMFRFILGVLHDTYNEFGEEGEELE